MHVDIVNKSDIANLHELTQRLVDFLEPCFGDVEFPVRLTIRKCRSSGVGVGGSAYAPTSTTGQVPEGYWRVSISVGRLGIYPRERSYKKQAGPVRVDDLAEELLHTIAHELRHVEQFAAARKLWIEGQRFKTTRYHDFRKNYAHQHYPHGSCEVDAELVAHQLLKGWRVFWAHQKAA